MNPRLKSLLLSLGAKALVPFTGIKGFVVRTIAKKVFIRLGRFIAHLLKLWEIEEKKRQEEKLKEKYDESLKDGVSEDKQRDDTLDFLNGARKR